MRQLFFVLLLSLLSSCTIGRFVWYNFADITDYKIFSSNEIPKSSKPISYPVKISSAASSSEITINGKTQTFNEFLHYSRTVAFVIIHKDTIKFEHYDYKYNDSSIVTSFSVAKSVTSILIGGAIADGLIKSIDEPITNYIPEMREEMKAVKIKHLLQMTSGIRYNESYYSPFSEAAEYYYGPNLRKAIPKLKLGVKPGTVFHYISGNSQVLGLVLERALKGKTVSAYLQEKIWNPMGMEFPATWSTDNKKSKLEKTFCCLNARAKDFAKIGTLYLHNGLYNGQQLVPKQWVAASNGKDTTEGAKLYYQYNWWRGYRKDTYLANGHLGQYIYIDPKNELVVVRFGNDRRSVNWYSVFAGISKGFDGR